MILLVTKTLEMTHSKLTIEGRAYAKIKKNKESIYNALEFQKTKQNWEFSQQSKYSIFHLLVKLSCKSSVKKDYASVYNASVKMINETVTKIIH